MCDTVRIHSNVLSSSLHKAFFYPDPSAGPDLRTYPRLVLLQGTLHVSMAVSITQAVGEYFLKESVHQLATDDVITNRNSVKMSAILHAPRSTLCFLTSTIVLGKVAH